MLKSNEMKERPYNKNTHTHDGRNYGDYRYARDVHRDTQVGGRERKNSSAHLPSRYLVPGIIESYFEGGNVAKEALKEFKKIPTSYLINPLFLHFKLLIDKMNGTIGTSEIGELERTLVLSVEKKIREPKSLEEYLKEKRQPQRLSYAEIRRIKTLIRMISRGAESANKRRARFLRKIYTILMRDSKKK